MSKKIRKILLTVAAVALAAIAILWGLERYFLHGLSDTAAKTTAIPSPTGVGSPIARGPDDWPSWRGARHDNASLTTGIRTDWRGGLKKAWEIAYLCQGSDSASWGAPAIQGRHLVVTGREKDRDLVFCLDAKTGALRWVSGYAATNPDNYGTGPRSTPAIDGDRVYTLGRGGQLCAWNLSDGALVWRRDLKADGADSPEWGHASSPLIAGEYLYMQAGGDATALALRKSSGELLWKRPGGPASYASPVLAHLAGKETLLILHADALAAFEPAAGQRLWDIPWKTANAGNITTPIVEGDLIVVSAAASRGAIAIQAGPAGTAVKWKTMALQAHHSDPHILGGYLYGYTGFSKQNGGDFVCLELATGRTEWKTNAIGCGTSVRVDGHLLCQDHKGNLFLVRPDPAGLRLVTSFPGAMAGAKEMTWTKPVVSDGLVYLRYRQRLLCYELRAPQSRSL